MKKYLVALVLICLFVVPSLLGGTTIRWRSDLYAYIVYLLTIGAILSLYLKINIWIRLLTLFLVVNCYLSEFPVVSFFSYTNYVGAFLLYLLCIRLSHKDFNFVLKIFPAFLIFQGLILCSQYVNRDILLKALDLGKFTQYGSVSNAMMFASLLVILAAPLALNKKWYVIPIFIMLFTFPQIHRMLAPLIVGCCFYIFFKIRHTKKIKVLFIIAFLIGSFFYMKYKTWELFLPGRRGPIWVRTIEMANDLKWKGWGIGTFKNIFPLNSGDIAGGWTAAYATKGEKWNIGGYEAGHIQWRRAHNFYVQFYFATGWSGIFLLLGLYLWVIWRFATAPKTDQLIITMAGLIVIALNMAETYPDKMVQLVPIMMFMLAYFTKLTEIPKKQCLIER